MAKWKVISGAASAQVESTEALGAVGMALPTLGLPPGSLARLVCAVGLDGTMEAVDPVTGVRVRVEPAADEVAQAEVLAEAEGMPYEGAVPAAGGDWIDAWLGGGGATTGELDTADLSDAERMEVLFERGSEIAEARDVRAACDVALRIARDLVPADAGSVLLESRRGRGLRFVAAVGPGADGVVGQLVPLEEGIAGFVHGFEMAVVVEDARQDVRHFGGIDRATGYRTRSILAVPVLGPEGGSYGCIEMLNPRRPFNAGDLQVAEGVAAALGAWLREAEA